MDYSQFYYTKTRLSSCSTNEYHHMYVNFIVEGKKKLFQKCFNKGIYSEDDVVAHIKRLIDLYGTPIPRSQRTHKAFCYATNYRGVKWVAGDAKKPEDAKNLAV